MRYFHEISENWEWSYRFFEKLKFRLNVRISATKWTKLIESKERLKTKVNPRILEPTKIRTKRLFFLNHAPRNEEPLKNLFQFDEEYRVSQKKVPTFENS